MIYRIGRYLAGVTCGHTLHTFTLHTWTGYLLGRLITVITFCLHSAILPDYHTFTVVPSTTVPTLRYIWDPLHFAIYIAMYIYTHLHTLQLDLHHIPGHSTVFTQVLRHLLHTRYAFIRCYIYYGLHSVTTHYYVTFPHPLLHFTRHTVYITFAGSTGSSAYTLLLRHTTFLRGTRVHFGTPCLPTLLRSGLHTRSGPHVGIHYVGRCLTTHYPVTIVPTHHYHIHSAPSDYSYSGTCWMPTTLPARYRFWAVDIPTDHIYRL